VGVCGRAVVMPTGVSLRVVVALLLLLVDQIEMGITCGSCG